MTGGFFLLREVREGLLEEGKGKKEHSWYREQHVLGPCNKSMANGKEGVAEAQITCRSGRRVLEAEAPVHRAI